MTKDWMYRLLGAPLLAILALSALPSPANADYWSDVANSGRCVSGCDVALPPAPVYDVVPPQAYTPPSALSVNYQGFLSLLAGFDGLTPAAGKFREMAEPSTTADYEIRVAWFYETAHREQDRLVQALEYIRSVQAEYRAWTERESSQAQILRPQVAALEKQFEPVRARAMTVANELLKWRDRVDRTRVAEKAWGDRAYQARASALGVLIAVAPSPLLQITDARIAAAETLESRPPVRQSDFPPLAQASLVAPRANDRVAWAPIDRALAIDQGLPVEAKITTLRFLAERMRATANTFDREFEVTMSVRSQWNTAIAQRSELESRIQALNNYLEGYALDAESDGKKLRQEQADFKVARDQMLLRAVQNWVWTKARDEIALPAAKDFLIANGLQPIAEKFRVGSLMQGIVAAREIDWSIVTRIRGANEFVAVQQKMLALLDPTKSRILQSAQFNALATTGEADAFAREVFEQLGDDGEDLIEAAGQTNLPPAYKGLAARLLRSQ